MIQYLSKVSPRKLAGVALLRLDFNTKDDWRMRASLPTLQLLLKYAQAIIILSHKGRPMGFQKELSLKKDAENIAGLLKKEVKFFDNFNFIEIKKEILSAKPKSVIALENLRFMPGEGDNNRDFAENLATLGDYFVNDAFAVSHRKNASICALADLLPSYAGLELESEINNLKKVMVSPQKPLALILGGAKIDDKLPLLKYFRKKANFFLLGGALANTLLHLKGIPMGTSVYEKNPGKDILSLLKYQNIVLPIDFRKEDTAILDIGPQTEKLFEEKIKSAKTIIWNGPLGMIERENFAKGTLAVAKAIAENTKVFSVIGGGETVSSLKSAGLDKHFSFVSTGGGAMLEFLSGIKLPGIEALEKQ